MAGRHCCVKNCRRRSHDHHGRRIPNGLTFHSFPAWRRDEGGQICELTKRRRAAWVAAVGRSSITFSLIPASVRVCSRHFHSGKPADEMLESDPDWVPSLQMGHGDGNGRHGERLLPSEQPGRRREKRRQTAERRRSHVSTRPPREWKAAGRGGASPAVLPCRDVKCLQSVLQRQTSTEQQPGDETGLSFRDFFRTSVEASLEVSSRSRTLSAQQPSISEDYRVELSFKLPPLKETNQTSEESSSSSSSCLNCVRLQRRIMELQEKLSHLPGEQQDVEASPVSNKTPPPPDQDLQIPETTVHIEDDLMEPVSPPQCDLGAGDQDVDSANKSTPACPAVVQDNSSKCEPAQTLHFQKAWLKKFWFLRYSRSLDQMWCHVCRLHADKSHQDLPLIKGSRAFQIQNIQQHSNSSYHKDNVEHHMWYVCDLKP